MRHPAGAIRLRHWPIWKATTGTGILIGDDGGDNHYSEGEVADLTIQGPGRDISKRTAIYIGGDPKSDPHGWGDHQNLNRARVSGWGTGIAWGNNVWSMTILESLISNNGTGLYYPSGLNNSGGIHQRHQHVDSEQSHGPGPYGLCRFLFLSLPL